MARNGPSDEEDKTYADGNKEKAEVSGFHETMTKSVSSCQIE